MKRLVLGDLPFDSVYEARVSWRESCRYGSVTHHVEGGVLMKVQVYTHPG